MWILIILIFIILIPILAMASEHDEKKKYQKEMEPFEKKYNAMASGRCNHIYGLHLSEGKQCIINFCPEKLVIESDGLVFNLKIIKIVDMNVKTSQEIQNSISNAAMGAFLLGPLGAALMGSKVQINRVFMIIYKDKEGEEKCMAFDLGNNINNLTYANNYIEAFNKQIRESKEVDL